MTQAREAARQADGKFGTQAHARAERHLFVPPADQQGQIVSSGYRVGDWSPDATTAAEIIDYEQDELGNNLGVSERLRGLLESVRARDVVWVTLDRSDTDRYIEANDGWEAYGASVEEYTYPEGALVLTSNDGDGGYLVLDLACVNPSERHEIESALRDIEVSS